MTDPLDELMYQAGLTAQGCWDEMDEYDREAILKFAQLIVRECAEVASQPLASTDAAYCHARVLKHFGVK